MKLGPCLVYTIVDLFSQWPESLASGGNLGEWERGRLHHILQSPVEPTPRS
jgi:hypothetical protein